MENCSEGAPNSSQDYYPYYNLFQKSIFYDTDNFRIAYLTYKYDDSLAADSGTRASESQESNAEHDDCRTESGPKWSEDFARSAEPPDKESEEEDEEPETEKRIITKEELYRNPDLFQSRSDDFDSSTPPAEPAYLENTQPWGYDWTRQSWVKGEGKRVVMNRREERREGRREERSNSRQWLYQQLVDAPRVQSSKAENMMQKMGWQGGALGKASDGILEPVTPRPIFGSRTEACARADAPARPRKLSKRDVFRTNVLMMIMEFVKDDTETELVFEPALKQHERRHVQLVVHHVIAAGNVAVLSSVAQYDLVQGIQARSQFLLATVSEGDAPDRYITIYKEAPEHVYLVTPGDFLPKEDDDEQTDTEQTRESQNKENAIIINDGMINKKVEKSMETDDEQNPFLKSIQKNLKKDDEPKNITNKFEKDCSIEPETVAVKVVPNPKAKILEFFLEFAGSDEYKELWFLGKFTKKQVKVINDLLNDVSTCIDDLDCFDGDEEIANVFKSGNTQFVLKEGCNGTTEIHKVSPVAVACSTEDFFSYKVI